jgi:hypothetical protein
MQHQHLFRYILRHLQARSNEAASAACVLALLALIVNARPAVEWLSRLTQISFGASSVALCMVASAWLLAAIVCARRALMLRHGDSYFDSRYEFESDVEWMERSLGLRSPDQESVSRDEQVLGGREPVDAALNRPRTASGQVSPWTWGA